MTTKKKKTDMVKVTGGALAEGQTPSGILLYQTDEGRSRIEVRMVDETVWLSQKAMAELFQKDVRTVSEHIQNIYDEHELGPEATIRKFRIVQTEGNREIAPVWWTSTTSI